MIYYEPFHGIMPVPGMIKLLQVKTQSSGPDRSQRRPLPARVGSLALGSLWPPVDRPRGQTTVTQWHAARFDASQPPLRVDSESAVTITD